MSKCAVYQWKEKFKVGRNNMEDGLCSHQPSNVLNKDNIVCVHNLLQEDHHYTVSDVHQEMTTLFE